MWRLSNCLFFILFHFLNLAGQESGVTYNVEHFGTKDGLSHRWLKAVYKDSKGFFWLTSYNGLNRYDGHEFIVYRPSTDGRFPIEADNLYEIAEDENGHLYLNSSYGIFSFIPKLKKFELILRAKENESILVYNQGRGAQILDTGIPFWSNMHGQLTFYKLAKNGKLTKISKIKSSITKDQYPVVCGNKGIWFWDFAGSYHFFDFTNHTWQKYPIKGLHYMPVDLNRTLWIPVTDGLKGFSLPAGINPLSFVAFSIEADKAVWLYSKKSDQIYDLNRLDIKDGSFNLSIPSITKGDFYNYRKSLTLQWGHLLDDEGTVWFAGFLGLYKARKTEPLFTKYLSKPVQHAEDPTTGFSARQIIEDQQGNLFIRDALARIHKLNPKTGASEIFRLPAIKERVAPNNLINIERSAKSFDIKILETCVSMTYDKDGFLWIVTPTGLSRYDLNNGKFKHYFYKFYKKEVPQNSYDDGRGNILLPVKDTIFIFNKGNGKLTSRPVLGVTSLLFGALIPEDNTLWTFSDKGLLNINTITYKVRNIPLFKEAREMRCLVSYKGWLWIGTSSGLVRVDPKTFSLTTYDRLNGLAGDFVYSILASGDYLWLGTSDGLSRFNVKTNEVRNYYVKDGLSHNEFNTFSTLKAKDGRIYMGGLNGVNGFLPADLEGKKNSGSRILLTRVSIYDSEKDSLIYLNVDDQMDGMEISPSVNSFSFHLALTSYIDPSKNQFAWRIDGFDKDWFYAGNQNVATYRYLPPGNYTFWAKAADSYGKWSKNKLKINFTILRPWYIRWWALLTYFIMAGGMGVWFYRFQIRKKREKAEAIKLKELDGFKTKFFTNITHEFRTPLTVIIGMTDGLMKGKESLSSVDLSKKAGLIKRNGELLLRLINQILDLAKLDSNKIEMHYVCGDVLLYLRYIAESIHSYANSMNVILKMESTSSEIIMDYDPERLMQIVHNLLSNAIKFSPSGGKVILFAGLTELHGQSFISIRVSDNGPGIPKEDLIRVFDRFYQVSDHETFHPGGTGIGLSLTKELVKILGGEITVNSTVGVGSEFQVLLPVTQKAEWKNEKIPLKKTAKLPDFSSDAPKDSPFILLIEDNEDVIEYLADCLGSELRIEYAINGRAGIDKALETSPDLIISDVMMPEKNGYEVCAALKNDERTSHIPIILLTAKVDTDSRITGLRTGADAYLAKPFHQEELIVTIHNLLESRKRLQVRYLEMAIGRSSVLPETDRETDTDIQIDSKENEFLFRLRSFVEENLSDSDLDTGKICRHLGMGRTNLYNKMKALTNLSVNIYIRKLRLHKAMDLIKSTDLNVSEIAYAVGFNDPKYLSRVFNEEFGMPPSSVKKKN